VVGSQQDTLPHWTGQDTQKAARYCTVICAVCALQCRAIGIDMLPVLFGLLFQLRLNPRPSPHLEKSGGKAGRFSKLIRSNELAAKNRERQLTRHNSGDLRFPVRQGEPIESAQFAPLTSSVGVFARAVTLLTVKSSPSQLEAGLRAPTSKAGEDCAHVGEIPRIGIRGSGSFLMAHSIGGCGDGGLQSRWAPRS
jgi:hypothetical protein